MSAEWLAISNELAEATEKIGAHAAAVHTEARGSTSGVIWRPGIIVTAEHALRRDEEIQVTLPDGKTAGAKLVGRDPSTDLAVLKCDEATAAPAAFGDSDALKAGNVTLVVGRTRASGPVAALSFVSLVTKARRLWGGDAVAPYVRLDVALQRTGIGGAVVNAEGKIVGVATPKFAPAGALAIPVTTANRVIDALLEKGRIPRGYLGVGLQPVRLPEGLRETLQRKEKTAAMVLEVEPDGPAHKAGVVIGDILTKIEGKPVMRLEDVQAHLHGEGIGKTVRAEFLRGGAPREVSIVVGERPDGSR
ncbi:MAG TPA: trypsin-like peptidase domain-containing protein [Candidatus Acidoferrum sp.]